MDKSAANDKNLLCSNDREEKGKWIRKSPYLLSAEKNHEHQVLKCKIISCHPPPATSLDESACADTTSIASLDKFVCGYTHLCFCCANHTKSTKRKEDRGDTATSSLGIRVTEIRK